MTASRNFPLGLRSATAAVPPCAAFVVALVVACGTLFTSDAQAQIKSPGQHPRYGAELEPHLVWQWDDNRGWDDDGIGVGFRASIPVIDNGPITSINNNFAVSFGLDWAHFEDLCPSNVDCSGDDFWVPIVVQWNFFLSPAVSLFPEIGLAIQHSRFGWDGPARGVCGPGFNGYCDDYNDTDIDLVLWIGGRFLVTDDIAIVLRLGIPSLNLGVSFLL